MSQSRPGSPPRVCIVGQTNGVGLDCDARLVRAQLESLSVSSEWRHPRSLSLRGRLAPRSLDAYDLVIFLERVFPAWTRRAETSVLIPNQERFPHRHLQRLRTVDHVFCKTKCAGEIFGKHHASVHHLGFTSPDRLDAAVDPDYQRFFHLAGRSFLKGTETLLDVWARHPDWPTLTLVVHPELAPSSVPPNVELLSRRLEEDELRTLQNRCGIHLCPSRSEGWGHYIAEAMSCRAVAVTTDAPPMNELVDANRGILLPFNQSEPRRLGTNYHVCPDRLADAVTRLLDTTPDSLATMGRQAREWFEENENRFALRFHELFTPLLSPAGP